MKKSVIFIIITVVAMCTGALESRSSTRKEDFIKSHAPPQHIIDGLKEHTEFFLKINDDCAGKICRKVHRHPVWKFDSLPGYYVKRNADRVKGREIVQRYITGHNLDLLTTPKKYLYHIPGTGAELNNNNYFVVSEDMMGNNAPLEITLDEAKQLCSLILGIAMLDLKGRNILRNSNGKIAVIDTETKWMHRFKKKCVGIDTIFTCKSYKFDSDFTQEALAYVLTQLKECNSFSRKRYNRVHKRLRLEPHPHKWDYVGFLEDLFPQYSQK